MLPSQLPTHIAVLRTIPTLSSLKQQQVLILFRRYCRVWQGWLLSAPQEISWDDFLGKLMTFRGGSLQFYASQLLLPLLVQNWALTWCCAYKLFSRSNHHSQKSEFLLFLMWSSRNMEGRIWEEFSWMSIYEVLLCSTHVGGSEIYTWYLILRSLQSSWEMILLKCSEGNKEDKLGGLLGGGDVCVES